MMMTFKHRNRRGNNAVEFALLVPALTALVMGMIDYGWFFSRQVMVTNTITAAVRSGSALQPTISDGAGACAPCTAAIQDHAVSGLSNLGITVDHSDVRPSIISIAGTCAFKLEVDIPHTPLVGFVATPAAYKVPAITLAQNVRGC